MLTSFFALVSRSQTSGQSKYLPSSKISHFFHAAGQYWQPESPSDDAQGDPLGYDREASEAGVPRPPAPHRGISPRGGSRQSGISGCGNMKIMFPHIA